MRSRAPVLRARLLIVDWRITTRRLDAIDSNRNAGTRAGDESLGSSKAPDFRRTVALTEPDRLDRPNEESR